jgi:preprotein translocase subunit YajC
VGRRVAAPLHSTGIDLTMPALSALLFTPSGQGGPAMGWFLFQLVAIFAIFYFLIIRPQRKQRERHAKLLASLQKGDRVVTSGGILGDVVHLKDDEVTVRSGEARFVVMRSNITNILNRSLEPKSQ